MKKLLNSVLMFTLLLCYQSCIDSKFIYEKEEESVIITTGAATDITSVSATVSGSVKNLAVGISNVEIGVVYSSSNTEPNINNDNRISSGHNTDGEFFVSLTDLSDGTTYYYRTYAKTNNKVYYGEVQSFTTKEIIVTTGSATDITRVSATISGSVENLVTEDGDNVEIGVVYSDTDSIPSIENSLIVKSDNKADGEFTISLANLNDGATYYYRSYAITDNNVYYGEVLSFATRAIIVTTGSATDITSVSATVSGSVENLVTEEGDNVEIGIIYSETDSIPNIENSFIVKSDKSTNGEFIVSLADLTDGVSYFYRSYVITDNKVYYGEISSFTTIDEITPSQEVDLGLSVKWAGWNVGATSPEQYGGYYAWGETEEKSDYSQGTYKYYDSQTGEYINIGDNISGTQYDVATVKWGDGWRMPTKEEITELNDECRFEGYTYKGVAGVKVTGPNGNTIFLPAAGNRGGTSLNGAGSGGYYWIGSLYENFSYHAWYLNVYSDGYHDVSDDYRGYGHSVRPVRDY